MSDAAPAGWHPDPRGRHEHRYWDGSQWTDHVADAGVMSTDPVAEVTPVAAPVGPSMVNLPAITPQQREPEPEPEPAAEPAGAGPLWSSEESATIPPTEEQAAPATSEEERPAGIAAEPATAHERSPDLAALLSVVAPGSGHVYLGRASGVAYGLLGATVAAVVLSYFSFLLFVVGLLIWAGAAAYALVDLRGGLAGIREARFSAHLVGWILVAAGGALILGLLLPWYHVSIDVSSRLAGIDASQTQNFSGFRIFTVIDIVLLVVGAASVVAGLAALGKGPISSDELPTAMPAILAGGALLALVLTFFRLFVDVVPGFEGFGSAASVDISVGRGPGALLCAAAALAILVASVSALTGPGHRTESVATA